MKSNVLWAIILVGLLFFMSNSPGEKEFKFEEDTEVSSLIDADVSFNGKNKFSVGTSLPDENVRVVRLNGGKNDLGSKSLNSGTLSVTPNTDYKFYFFMNSTGPSNDYYVDAEDYTAKVQDSVDNVVGEGCEIDTNPVITVRNPSGYTQSASANALAFAAGETKEVEIDIKSHLDKCIGTPGAPNGNAICFIYNTAAFSSIKSNVRNLPPPTSVTTATSGTARCYEFDLLENGAKQTITFSLTSNGDPTTAHNISIYTDDRAFDLDATNLNEIWDFTDEKGNQLSRVVNSSEDGKIYVS